MNYVPISRAPRYSSLCMHTFQLYAGYYLCAYHCINCALVMNHPKYPCFRFVEDPNDVLHQVLNTMDELKALLPSLMMMSNPFQSASSLSSKHAEAQASDFKARLLQYYFTLPNPPGLLLPQAQAHLTLQCMVSKLCLSSNLIEAAHIVPKASAQVRALLAVISQPSNACLHECRFAVGRLHFGFD